MNSQRQLDSLIRLPEGRLLRGSAELNAPARDVWRLVGNFAGFPAFIPPMAWIEMTGTGVRSIRKKFFKDGNIVMEQLNSHDNERMRMTWSLLYSTFNIGNLWSEMRVEPVASSRCNVVWEIVGEPWEGGAAAVPEFEKFIEGYLDMAMSNIKAMFNK
jgi:hypothetical protein